MSDQKLYLLDDIGSIGVGLLLYTSTADGSDDGKVSFTQLAPVFAGVLAPTFAPLTHTHAYSDLTGLPTLFSGAYADLSGKPTLGALADQDTVNNGDWSGTALSVANGGTGATSAGAARTALGISTVGNTGAYADLSGLPTLGSLAALSTINGGNWSGTDLAVVDGGTGASSASAARTNLGLVIGADVQAFDADLSALAALSGTNTIYYRSAANTWTAVTIGATLSFSAGTLGFDLTHANAWTGKQDLGAGGDLTPAATPATNAIGYLGAPQNIQNGTYTTVMGDAGKHLYHTSGSAHTWTIDSNANVAYPIGTILTFANESGGGVVTLAITSDTLRWGSSTGSRSLAANGTATALKVASTTWRLTGDGIT